MSKEQLLELAERCERAKGLDRVLNGDIAQALGHVPPFVHHRSGPYMDTWLGGRDAWTAPSYTSSLDAAMTLVPEGWYLADLEQSMGDDKWCATFVTGTMYASCFFANNAALALCAAALRARASNQPEAVD